jgi:hypothetical protein
MNWLIHLMRRKPEAREAELLADAKMALIEHEAAAEHHDALATMLRHRIERLSPPPVIDSGLKDFMREADKIMGEALVVRKPTDYRAKP